MTSASFISRFRQDSPFLSFHHERRRHIRRDGFVGACAGMALFLSGCSVFSPPPVPRGALLDQADYKQLIPGSSTRSDTLGLIGSPTAHATFDDNTWIYIAMTKYLVPLSHPAVNTQHVLVLNFDQGGVLQHMTLLGKKDGVNVSMVGKTTPTPGTHISVFQELIGNVGRYNPLSSMGSTFGGVNNGALGGNGPLNGQGPGNGGVGNSMP